VSEHSEHPDTTPVRHDTQRSAEAMLAENEQLAALLTAVGEEKTHIARELAALKEQCAREARLQARLVERVARMEASVQNAEERGVDVEESAAFITTLYVAGSRIRGSLDRQEVLLALGEVVVNLVGSEAFAILDRVTCGGPLTVASSMGVTDARARIEGLRLEEWMTDAILLRDGPARACGETATPLPSGVTACLPLRVEGNVVGAIVIFELLAHKAHLEGTDRELLELLAREAATALYCSQLHAAATRGRP
jgi:hypothetical protein